MLPSWYNFINEDWNFFIILSDGLYEAYAAAVSLDLEYLDIFPGVSIHNIVPQFISSMANGIIEEVFPCVIFFEIDNATFDKARFVVKKRYFISLRWYIGLP